MNTSDMAHQLCARIGKNSGAKEYSRKDHARVVELLHFPFKIEGDPVCGKATPANIQKNYDNAILFINHNKTMSVDQLLTMHNEDGLVDTPWARFDEL
jgi:hypothetical protein